MYPSIQQQVRFEAERDSAFTHKIQSTHGGEKLEHCIQCGSCSGVCPLSIYMDYTPRRIINLTRAGFKKEVLASQTIWLCSSCYACTVSCPKGIQITDIMYALKQQAIREEHYPEKFTIPLLSQEFFKMVRQHGRITEFLLVLKLYLKTNWFKLLGMWKLGLRLILRNRIPYRLDSVKAPKSIARMMDQGKMVKPPIPPSD